MTDTCAKLFAIGLAALGWGCANSHHVYVRTEMPQSASDCQEITVEQLWLAPRSFAGDRVCVTGFLGSMVAYGEESAELFATREAAEARTSEHYITVSAPMGGPEQVELAGLSGQPLTIVGKFELSEICWPPGVSESQCYDRGIHITDPVVVRR
jgi:hypothetical protein